MLKLVSIWVFSLGLLMGCARSPSNQDAVCEVSASVLGYIQERSQREILFVDPGARALFGKGEAWPDAPDMIISSMESVSTDQMLPTGAFGVGASFEDAVPFDLTTCGDKNPEYVKFSDDNSSSEEMGTTRFIFSPILFSEDKAYALLHLTAECNGWCGWGRYFLISRNRDSWRVIGEALSWIA